MNIKAIPLLGLSILATTVVQATTIDLTGTIRDFSVNHPDMQFAISGLDTGIVETTLGGDGKPVFAPADDPTNTDGTFISVTTEENFNQWYNDESGVNQSKQHTITLNDDGVNGDDTANDEIFTFSDNTFSD